MGRPYWRLLILPLLLSALFHALLPSPARGDVLPSLLVFSDDYSSSNIVDASLVKGSAFNMSVEASYLPPITDESSGGIEGFDISINYNSSILKADEASFNAPLCPSSEGCVFDLPPNDTFSFAKSLNSPLGTSRLAMVVLGPGHRASSSGATSTPALLFRVQFEVVGRGVTPIQIQRGLSGLIGFAKGCGQIISSYTVANGSFDNRPPIVISANPSSISVPQGGYGSTSVTVTRVSNLYADLNVTLLLSGVTAEMMTSYSFKPRSVILPAGVLSFTSNLTIATSTGTPPGNYALEVVGVSSVDSSFPYRLNFTLSVKSLTLQPLGLPPHGSASPVEAGTGDFGMIGPLQLPLLASFNVSASPLAGSVATFTPTVCGGAPPYSLGWSFGDGVTVGGNLMSSGTSSVMSHSYSAPGTYNAILTVTDANGASFTSSQMVAVRGGEFSTSNLPLIASAGVTFTLVLAIVSLTYLSRRSRRSRP